MSEEFSRAARRMERAATVGMIAGSIVTVVWALAIAYSVGAGVFAIGRYVGAW